VRVERKEPSGEADPLEEGVLVREPEGVFASAGDVKQLAPGTGKRIGEVAKERPDAADRRT